MDRDKRVFQPKGYIPYRLLGIGLVQFTSMRISKNFVDLILSLDPIQLGVIGNRLDSVIDQGSDIVGEASRSVENVYLNSYEINFYLGERLVSQNLMRFFIFSDRL